MVFLMGLFIFCQRVSVLRGRCFQTGRRARPVGPRGDTRSVLQAGPQAPAVAALRGPHQPSAVQSQVVPRSAPSGMRVQSQAPVQSLQTPVSYINYISFNIEIQIVLLYMIFIIN